MTRNPVMIAATVFAAIFISVLGGIMVWLYASEPERGPFDQKFSLIDDRGNPVDAGLFRGHPSLLYFGYTHCPEICPTTLFEVSDWLKTLGPEAKDLRVFFLTVDPARDTKDVMHQYVTSFSDRITGITGSEKEMTKVVEGWRIHASRLPSSDGDYHMSHTVSLLMVGADGRLKGLIPYGVDKDEALADIRSSLLVRQ